MLSITVIIDHLQTPSSKVLDQRPDPSINTAIYLSVQGGIGSHGFLQITATTATIIFVVRHITYSRSHIHIFPACAACKPMIWFVS